MPEKKYYYAPSKLRTDQLFGERNWPTSFSLIPEMLKKFGEDDRFEDNELLDDVGFVLEIILQNCNACLYVCCQQQKRNEHIILKN